MVYLYIIQVLECGIPLYNTGIGVCRYWSVVYLYIIHVLECGIPLYNTGIGVSMFHNFI